MYPKNIIWLRTVFCAIIALLTAACDNRQRMASLSDEAIMAAATSNDSAQSLYSRTDSSALNTDEDHARYNVLKLLVDANNKKDTESDSVAMTVEKYFNESNNKNEVKAAALIATGQAFEQTGDDEKAMLCTCRQAARGLTPMDFALYCICPLGVVAQGGTAVRRGYSQAANCREIRQKTWRQQPLGTYTWNAGMDYVVPKQV